MTDSQRVKVMWASGEPIFDEVVPVGGDVLGVLRLEANPAGGHHLVPVEPRERMTT